MSNIIIFDLDDTLINTRKRHYNVVKSFYCSKCSKNFVDFETYQTLRLSGFSNFEIERISTAKTADLPARAGLK